MMDIVQTLEREGPQHLLQYGLELHEHLRCHLSSSWMQRY